MSCISSFQFFNIAASSVSSLVSLRKTSLFPLSFSGIDGDESSVAKVEPVALDAADAHAIEEVNLAYENVKDVDVLDTSKEGTDLWEAAVKRYEERIDR